MKPLELSQEQRDKLLEMCKKLFPEYSVHFTKDYYSLKGDVEHLKGSINNLIIFEAMFGGTWKGTIHWFEFCMTYLTSKLNDLYDEKNKAILESEDDNIRLTAWCNRPYEHVWSMLNLGYPKPNNGHPVDCLYEHFKKLK